MSSSRVTPRLNEAYMAFISRLFRSLYARSEGRVLLVDDFGDGDGSLEYWKSLPIEISGTPGRPEVRRGGISVEMGDPSLISISFAVKNKLVKEGRVERFVRPLQVEGAERNLGVMSAPLSRDDVHEMQSYADSEPEGIFWAENSRYMQDNFSSQEFELYAKVNPLNAMAVMLFTVSGTGAIERMAEWVVGGLVEGAAREMKGGKK